MSEQAAEHTPQWLEEIATRLQQSDTMGADGIAYALEWAASDIRLLERRLATALDTSQAMVACLKVEVARLDAELVALKAKENEGAWS